MARRTEDRTPVMDVIDPAKVGLPSRPLTDPDLVTDALSLALSKRWNVLAPVTAIQSIPANHQVAIRIVQFDATFTEEDQAAKGNGTYYLTDNGKLAHARPALDLLAATAGLSWEPQGCYREDDGSERFLWSWRMTATIKSMDGQVRRISRSRTIDLRDGSAEIVTVKSQGRDRDPAIYDWSPARLAKAREYGAAMAESKAANRVIRAALGLKGGYTREQAAAPFVFPCLVYVMPDTPEIRMLQAAVELGVVGQVYGPRAGRLVEPVELHGGLAHPGQVLEGQAAPRQLPAPGPEPRDFRAEAERLNQRQPVRRQELPPDLEDDDREDEGDPWDRGNRAPDPRQDDRGRRDDRRQSPPPDEADFCAHQERGRECGRSLTAGTAAYSRDRFGLPLCRDHQAAHQPTARGPRR